MMLGPDRAIAALERPGVCRVMAESRHRRSRHPPGTCAAADLALRRAPSARMRCSARPWMAVSRGDDGRGQDAGKHGSQAVRAPPGGGVGPVAASGRMRSATARSSGALALKKGS